MSMLDKMMENLWKKYSKDPAKILVQTGTAGWALSSAAQIIALLMNDKISTKEKTFLIPQETFDAIVNIGSFFLITSGIKKLATKLVTTGKITPKNIRTYLENSPFKNDMGKSHFNIEKDLQGLTSFNEHRPQYDAFKNIFTTGSTIGASILSCNIITPIVRNNLAAFSHNTIVKNAHSGKNSIFTKEELENRNSKVLQLNPKTMVYPKSAGLKI